jgi:hypothetical protein
MDALSTTTPTTLGYIFGGIFSNAPHTQGNPNAVSGGSNLIFEVVYRPVPEPCAVVVVLVPLALVQRARRSR